MRQGAGITVLCKLAFRFSQFGLSKAGFIYIVRSPRFIPSPYFIPSPQSIFYTDRSMEDVNTRQRFSFSFVKKSPTLDKLT